MTVVYKGGGKSLPGTYRQVPAVALSGSLTLNKVTVVGCHALLDGQLNDKHETREKIKDRDPKQLQLDTKQHLLFIDSVSY